MANVNLYLKYDFTDDAGNLYSDGSTTTAKTIGITDGEIFDRTYVLPSNPATGPVEILNDDKIGVPATPATFDFLWIESDQAAEIQLLCNQGGVIGGSNLENAFVIKLTAGIPFILTSDDSRNRGDMATAVDATNYAAEINTWETNWGTTDNKIDRIEFYHQTGTDAKVRVFAVRGT
jgi:hypothetical protein